MMKRNFVNNLIRLFSRTKTNTSQLFELLPVEILDMILRKSCLLGVLYKSELLLQNDTDIIFVLASVNYHWFQLITSTKFKRNVLKHLKGVRSIVCSFGARLEVEGNISIRGVTKLRNQIHVLSRSSSSSTWISMFEDENPFRLQKKMEINEIKNPQYIGSGEKKNCLYVSDYDREESKSCIWKIKESSDGDHQVTKWLKYVKSDDPLTLSVSSGGQLLTVACNGQSFRLLIYGPDAKLRHSIKLPRCFRSVYYAVETTKGNFFISHTWVKNKGEYQLDKYSVSHLTRDGSVIRTFIPKDGNQELDLSRCLSLDSYNRVIVADSSNHRVILLDSDLKWNRILFATEEDEKTGRYIGVYRLCFDERKKQLIFGGISEVCVCSLNWK